MYLCRLCAERGQLSPVLYAAYYLPTSINTAWLSVASCIGVLIVANVLETPRREYGAVLLAAGTTAAGTASNAHLISCVQALHHYKRTTDALINAQPMH